MRALIVMGLVLAVVAGGCFDTPATSGHRHHQRQPLTGPQKHKRAPSQQSPSGQPVKAHASRSNQWKANHWHEIILLRQHIEQVRYSALQLAPPRDTRLRDRYPEFQTTSTKRLSHILGHWQERLARW